MKKYNLPAIAQLVVVILCTIGFAALAQEKPQNATKPVSTPAPKIEDPKADKPIIVTKQQILQSENLALKVQNAQLQAQAAIPAELKKAVEQAEAALNDFYLKEIGVSRSELSNYEISNGTDGALILKRKAATPKAEEKK